MAARRTTSTDKYIGNRVRMRRLELRMSQVDLADRLGITFQQVQKYENGVNRISASRLQRISQVLDVPIYFFFEGAGESSQNQQKRGQRASASQVTDFLATPDAHALMRAFMRIKDPKLRRWVVRTVRALPQGGHS